MSANHFSRFAVAVALWLCAAASAAAQGTPALSIRPFVMFTEQSFAAVDTFDAVFGKTYAPFFGGGVQVVVSDGFFVELTASRFRQTGERAFLSGGQAFKLGIPLTATITPFEVSARYPLLAAEAAACATVRRGRLRIHSDTRKPPICRSPARTSTSGIPASS